MVVVYSPVCMLVLNDVDDLHVTEHIADSAARAHGA